MQPRLVPRGQNYKIQRDALWAITELPYAGKLRRPAIEFARRARPEVAWRNHEASLDVASLEPYSRNVSTYALDEFFVPPRHFESFTRELTLILHSRRVDAVSISIRHSPADTLSLLPWARQILVRRFLDGKRWSLRRPHCSIEGVEVATSLGTGPELVDLRAAVARLSREDRALLVLHYWQGLSIAECARELGVPDGTAKSRMNRALTRLRATMGEATA